VNDVPVTVHAIALVDAQNAPSGAASMVMGTAHHNVPNGGSLCGRAVTRVALRNRLPVSLRPGLEEFTAAG
jgi:hypothetical protein